MERESMVKGMCQSLLGTDQRFWISHRHRLIFLSIPKNANSFLRGLFVSNHEAATSFDPARESVLTYHRRAGTRGIALRNRGYLAHPEYTSFVALRDPMARLVSAFLDKFVKKIVRGDADRPSARFYRQAARCCRQAVDADTVTFRHFLAHAVATPDGRRNKHCRSQAHFVRDHGFDVFGDIADMDHILLFFARCGLDVSAAEQRWHKRTSYRARRAPWPTHPADMTPHQLARFPSFPAPADFFDAELMALLQRGYQVDIDLYCRVTGQHRNTLCNRYAAPACPEPTPA